jgi:hypothetical protein
LELSPIPFSLRECIREAIATLGSRTARRAYLAADVSRELPDKVIGGPFRLRQILLNSAEQRDQIYQFGNDSAGVERAQV